MKNGWSVLSGAISYGFARILFDSGPGAVMFGVIGLGAMWTVMHFASIPVNVTVFHDGPMDGQRLGGEPDGPARFPAEFNGRAGSITYIPRVGIEIAGREMVHHMSYQGFEESD